MCVILSFYSPFSNLCWKLNVIYNSFFKRVKMVFYGQKFEENKKWLLLLTDIFFKKSSWFLISSIPLNFFKQVLLPGVSQLDPRDPMSLFTDHGKAMMANGFNILRLGAASSAHSAHQPFALLPHLTKSPLHLNPPPLSTHSSPRPLPFCLKPNSLLKEGAGSSQGSYVKDLPTTTIKQLAWEGMMTPYFFIICIGRYRHLACKHDDPCPTTRLTLQSVHRG